MIFDLSAKEQVWSDKAFEKVVFPHDQIPHFVFHSDCDSVVEEEKILIQLIEACFLAFNAVASLVLLIVAGSRIQETHGKIRSLLFGMIEFREHQHVPLRYEILPLLKTFVEKEDMIMTAAGMIPVTRSLFLKIGAALVTYGVLIVQLDTSDDP
ncbi:uncharacterized protein TNIN_422581 [Trichonephila inaurata madagascariensis]|uniref:Uncharacterized protein n=1 Tax=Trichonephila inaurata madagascariensis TaxID=2747483 RepID=A0A8X7C463_9ARAC|nr:uncharacterized protein TNIN_422581 [Trichonephila inaurata madagascariensis]